MKNEDKPEGLIVVEEAARRLGVSLSKVYAMAQKGELRRAKIGRAVRICPASVRAVIEGSQGARR